MCECGGERAVGRGIPCGKPSQVGGGAHHVGCGPRAGADDDALIHAAPLQRPLPVAQQTGGGVRGSFTALVVGAAVSATPARSRTHHLVSVVLIPEALDSSSRFFHAFSSIVAAA